MSQARIAPAAPPFPEEVRRRVDAITPKGVTTPVLFTTLANDERLFLRFVGGGLLDRGHLTLRQREIVILRVTALNKSEYEWGLHAVGFAPKAGLSDADLARTVHGGSEGWDEEGALLVRFCDALQAHSTIDDALWAELRARFSEMAVLELLMLAGFYRTTSYITNALKLPPEAYAPRFPPLNPDD